jgi:hypothetical protein
MMITRRVWSYCWRPLVVALCIGTALLASGCLWGVVTDAETGAPVGGATIRYADSTGQTGTTTADANGIYSFDGSNGPIPAAGPVNFVVDAGGYEPLTETRQVGLGGVQSFSLAPESSGPSESSMYHNARWGFSIRFPDDWMVAEAEDQEEGTAVMGMAPPENGNEEYPEFCLVFAGELEPGITLETFFELMLASLEEDSPEVQQLDAGEADVNGQDAKWLVVSVDDPDLNMEIMSLLYMLVKEPRGYMIMCMAEAAQFEIQRSELEGIAESFRID